MYSILDHIGCVMVSVLALSVVDRWLSNSREKTNTIKLVFVASPQSKTRYIKE